MSNGNYSYVTGSFSDTLFDIYNKNGTLFKTLTNTGSGYDVFVVKYDSNGYGLWAAQMGGTTGDSGVNITTDANNYVYITGYFTFTLFDIYNKNGTLFKTLTNTGSSGDAFVVKYDSNGQGQWAAQMGGTTGDSGASITTDTNNNVYITGTFTSTSFTIYNENGSLFKTLTINASTYHVFVVKYNSNGQGQWATKMGSTSAGSEGKSILVDVNNNIYVTGYFSETSFDIYNADGITFTTINNTSTPASQNVFLVQYNSTGVVQWATKMGSLLNGGNDIGFNLSIDTNNYLYITGTFSDASFNIYNTNNNVPFTTLSNTTGSSGVNNVFLVKYNSNGQGIWATTMGATITNYFNNISIDLDNYIYITGTFIETLFNIYNKNGSPFKTLSNTGSPTDQYDVFVVKFDSNGQGIWATKMGSLNNQSLANSICCNKSIYIGNPLLQSTNPSPLILFYPGTITLNYYGNIADQYQLINNLGQVVSSTFSFNSTNQTITFNVIIQYGGNNILSFYDTT